MLALAGPVVLAELGWMAMGTVDTIMLGRVGREALGGASTAEAVHHSVVLFGIGILLGMDTLVSQAFGAKDLDGCDHTLRQGVWLAVLMTPVLMSIVAVSPEALNGVYGGTKAYVLALSLSLHKELADKNVRVQAVVPGATATDFWEIAGRPVEHLPAQIVMRADDMVDAALAGLDQGELVTIPSLPDATDWQSYEAARQKLMPNLSLSVPAARYGARAAA